MDAVFEERLCAEVRRYPHLYNSTLRQYKDVQMCTNTWREIARSLGTSEGVCRQKWKYLRDRFVKAKKKMKASSAAGEKFSIPPIVCLLSWLSEFVRHRSTESHFPAELQRLNTLERHPLLLLAKRHGQRFVAECLHPNEMATEQEKNALLTIQRTYERLLNDEWEERGVTGHCCEREAKERTAREMGCRMQRRCMEGFEDGENADDRLDSSTSEEHDQDFASGYIRNTISSPIQRCIKEESLEAVCDDHLTESLSVLVECKYEDTDATNSEHKAAELQEMKLEKSVLQTTRTSDVTQSSNMAEAPSSSPSASCDLDNLDLDQLRREKIKMQIKVLRLQEEYYIQKIKKVNK